MNTTLGRLGCVALLLSSPALLAAKGCSFGSDDVPLGSNGDAGAGNEGGAGPATGTGGTAAGAGGTSSGKGGGSNAGSGGIVDPTPTTEERACLEQLTPISGANPTPLGFSAEDALQLIRGKHVAGQYLIAGGASSVEFQMVRAELFYVESTVNPDFNLDIAVTCDDHVRAVGPARFVSADGSFDETFPAFELDIGSTTASGAGDAAENLVAGGVISLESDELRGNYRPTLGIDQCYLAMQFNVGLGATGFDGTFIETILNAPCGDTSPTTAVLGRDAGAWGCGVGGVECAREAADAFVLLEADGCAGLGEQVTHAGDESEFELAGSRITRDMAWGAGCIDTPEWVLTYVPSSPIDLRLCHDELSDPCEALGGPLAFDLGTAFIAAGTTEFRFVD